MAHNWFMTRRNPSTPGAPWGRLALLSLATLPLVFFGLVIVGFRDDAKVNEGQWWTLAAVAWLLQGGVAYRMLRKRAIRVRRAALMAAAIFPLTYLSLVIVIVAVVLLSS
jgi:hypothetical protein